MSPQPLLHPAFKMTVLSRQLLAGNGDQCPHLPPGPLLTMFSLPFLCTALDTATEVSTLAAKEQ